MCSLARLRCLDRYTVNISNMPKISKKRTGGGSGPYDSPARPHAVNNVFKMNTDLGQHVLKNPGVAQAIVDKADLKQSDVRNTLHLLFPTSILTRLDSPRSWARNRQSHSPHPRKGQEMHSRGDGSSKYTASFSPKPTPTQTHLSFSLADSDQH